MSSARRRIAAWSGTLFVGALLPLAGPALLAPVTAAESCTTEETPAPTFPPTIPTDYGCDDTTPPDTVITGMTPQPNDAGLTSSNDVTFTFEEVVSDNDGGPWTFMCRLQGPSQSSDTYTDCTSPQTYNDLEDGDQAAYTFSVYAVDTSDAAILFTGDPLTTSDDEDAAQPDDDSASPATRTWKQDTTAPVAYIFPAKNGTPYDGQGTGWPVATSPKVSYLLDASEDGVTYRCQLDGANVACGAGENTFGPIAGGQHVLSVSVTDKAGNQDESPATKQFVMPYNLTSARGWKKVAGDGYFAGDVLQTKKYGATVKFTARNIEQFQLMAPANAKLGKIQVRLGEWKWKTYDLSKGKKAKVRFIDLRGPNPPLFSGPIQIRNITGGKLVQVDAFVFPPS